MSGSAQSRIAAAIREHRPSDIGFCTAEGCAWRYWPDSDHAEHVAAVVLASLNDAGYTLMRPITAEEEARNVW